MHLMDLKFEHQQQQADALYILEDAICIRGNIFSDWCKTSYALDVIHEFNYADIMEATKNVAGYGSIYKLCCSNSLFKYTNPKVYYLSFDYISSEINSIVIEFLEMNYKLIVTFAFDQIYSSNLIEKYSDFTFFLSIVVSKSINPNYLAMILYGNCKLIRNPSPKFNIFFANEIQAILDSITDSQNITILSLEKTKIDKQKFTPSPITSKDFLKLITHDIKIKEKIQIASTSIYISHGRYVFPFNSASNQLLKYDLLKYSSGCDEDQDQSILKAEMEGAERYLSMNEWQTTSSSMQDLTSGFLSPDQMQQLVSNKLQHFDPTIEYYWIEATDIINNTVIKINSDFITYPSINKLPIHVSNSNGFAIHTNLEQAKASALYELIERDNLLFTFFFKKKVYRITNDNISVQNKAIIDYIEDLGYRTYIIYSSIDINVHSIFTLAINNHRADRPFCITAGACNIDLEVATGKSLQELVTGLIYAVEKKNWKKYDSVSEVKNLLDHRDYYFNSNSNIVFDNIFNSIPLSNNIKTINFQSYQTESEYLESQFKQLDLRLYCVIKVLNFSDKSFYLVKYISPDLIPMDFGHQNLRLPQIITLERRGEQALNFDKLVYPHPFA